MSSCKRLSSNKQQFVFIKIRIAIRDRVLLRGNAHATNYACNAYSDPATASVDLLRALAVLLLCSYCCGIWYSVLKCYYRFEDLYLFPLSGLWYKTICV